jgi:hypothetical protein
MLLALPLAMPAVHFVSYRADWHPGQYALALPTVSHLLATSRNLAGAIGVDFLGVGLVMALVVVLVTVRPLLPGLWLRWRGPLAAGTALVIGGVAVYLPVTGIAARYSMPAAWGIDLALAVLFSELARAAAGWKRPAAALALGCGLAAALLANFGKQDKFIQRVALLWQTLARVERDAPANACIGWLSSTALDAEEGIHFAWHLKHRGRRPDLKLRLFTADGQSMQRVELPPVQETPDLFVSGAAAPPPSGPWCVLETFTAPYWAGKRCWHCYLWDRPGRTATARARTP